jgi:hypothetical protein
MNQNTEIIEMIDQASAQREREQAHADKIRPFCTAALKTINEARKNLVEINALRINPADFAILKKDGQPPIRLWGYSLITDASVPAGEVKPFTVKPWREWPEEFTVHFPQEEGEAEVTLTIKGMKANEEAIQRVRDFCAELAERYKGAE